MVTADGDIFTRSSLRSEIHLDWQNAMVDREKAKGFQQVSDTLSSRVWGPEIFVPASPRAQEQYRVRHENYTKYSPEKGEFIIHYCSSHPNNGTGHMILRNTPTKGEHIIFNVHSTDYYNSATPLPEKMKTTQNLLDPEPWTRKIMGWTKKIMTRQEVDEVNNSPYFLSDQKLPIPPLPLKEKALLKFEAVKNAVKTFFDRLQSHQ
jgi:hypothetical protein